MAITLISTPGSLHYAGNGCATYVFNMDTIGTPTAKRQIRWQVQMTDRVNGNRIELSKVQAFTPKQAGQFEIDISDYISAGLLPIDIDPNAPITQVMQQQFFLFYWEYELVNNGVTCSANPIAGRFQTPPSDVINGGTQYWEGNDALTLNRKPECMEICEGHTDYITLRGPAIITIDGVEVYNEPDVGFDYYRTFLLDQMNTAFANGADESIVVVSEAGATRTYRYIKKCCNNPETQIIFKENRGGWSSISMCDIQDIDFTNTYQSFVKNIGCNTPQSITNRLFGGAVKNCLEASEIRTYLFQMDDSIEQRRWIQNFISSPQHIINTVDSQGNEIHVSACLDQSTYKTFNLIDCVTLVLRFTIDQPINTPVNV